MESAVPSASKIGECAASLLKQLFDQRPEINLDKFHFIGFSLGAQICAQISNNLQPLRIPRITGEYSKIQSQKCVATYVCCASNGHLFIRYVAVKGCDPALTGSFYGAPDSVNANTLNRQHANFVDSILTNMGAIGVSFSSSHYDMYANDGVTQPGCNEARGGRFSF